uniref:Uncharacterized protein n=1 Tax=Knipowitschia caucasica TaxID=637954 RepID=A0AAV2LY92_KNICA
MVGFVVVYHEDEGEILRLHKAGVSSVRCNHGEFSIDGRGASWCVARASVFILAIIVGFIGPYRDLDSSARALGTRVGFYLSDPTSIESSVTQIKANRGGYIEIGKTFRLDRYSCCILQGERSALHGLDEELDESDSRRSSGDDELDDETGGESICAVSSARGAARVIATWLARVHWACTLLVRYLRRPSKQLMLGRKTAHKLSLLLRNPLPISRPLRYRSTNPLGHIVMRFSPVSPRWIRRMYLRHYDARRRSLRRPLGVVDALLTDLPIHSTDSHLLSSRTAVSSLVAASLKSLSHATIADLYFKRYPRVHLKVCGSGGLCSVAGV